MFRHCEWRTPVRARIGGLGLRPPWRAHPATFRSAGSRARRRDGSKLGAARWYRPRPCYSRCAEVLPAAAETKRLRAGAALFPAHRLQNTRVRGAERDRARVHHSSPCAALYRLCPEPVETLRKRAAAAREAFAIRVSSFADRHSPAPVRRSRSKFGDTER